MIDHKARQQDSARRERRELIAENVSFDQFRNNCKKYPAGSVHYWCWQAVCGPIGSAERKRDAAA